MYQCIELPLIWGPMNWTGRMSTAGEGRCGPLHISDGILSRMFFYLRYRKYATYIDLIKCFFFLTSKQIRSPMFCLFFLKDCSFNNGCTSVMHLQKSKPRWSLNNCHHFEYLFHIKHRKYYPEVQK